MRLPMKTWHQLIQAQCNAFLDGKQRGKSKGMERDINEPKPRTDESSSQAGLKPTPSLEQRKTIEETHKRNESVLSVLSVVKF